MMMMMIPSVEHRVRQERESQYLSVSGTDGSYQTPKCQSEFLHYFFYFNLFPNDRSRYKLLCGPCGQVTHSLFFLFSPEPLIPPSR